MSLPDGLSTNQDAMVSDPQSLHFPRWSKVIIPHIPPMISGMVDEILQKWGIDDAFFLKIESLDAKKQEDMLQCMFLYGHRTIYTMYISYIQRRHYVSNYEIPTSIVECIRHSTDLQRASIEYVRECLATLSWDQLISGDAVMNFCLNILSLSQTLDYMRELENGSFLSIEQLLDQTNERLIRLSEHISCENIEWEIGGNIIPLLHRWANQLNSQESEFLLQYTRTIEILEVINKIGLSRTPNKQQCIINHLQKTLGRSIRSIFSMIGQLLQIELSFVSEYDNIEQLYMSIKTLYAWIEHHISKYTPGKTPIFLMELHKTENPF